MWKWFLRESQKLCLHSMQKLLTETSKGWVRCSLLRIFEGYPCSRLWCMLLKRLGRKRERKGWVEGCWVREWEWEYIYKGKVTLKMNMTGLEGLLEGHVICEGLLGPHRVSEKKKKMQWNLGVEVHMLGSCFDTPSIILESKHTFFSKDFFFTFKLFFIHLNFYIYFTLPFLFFFLFSFLFKKYKIYIFIIILSS